jgi:uncharacterized protein YggE
MYRILIALLISTSALLAQPDYAISVNGSATKEVEAIQLILSMGIDLRGDNAQDIFNQCSEIYNKGLEALRKRKKQCSFSTDIVRLTTRYGYQQQKNANVKSFEANQSLKIVITDLDAYGDIVTELLEIGFNGIRSTEFTYSKPEELKKEVLTMAIAAGEAKAKMVASEMGVSIGKISYFKEMSSRSPYSNVVSRTDGILSKPSSVNIEAATVNLSVTVSMTYSIDYTPYNRVTPEK